MNTIRLTAKEHCIILAALHHLDAAWSKGTANSNFDQKTMDLLRGQNSPLPHESDVGRMLHDLEDGRIQLARVPNEGPLRDWMPLLGTMKGLAMRMDLLNETQAQRNHGQSLDRLAERGGLGASEAMAIAEMRAWRSMNATEAIEMLLVKAKEQES